MMRNLCACLIAMSLAVGCREPAVQDEPSGGDFFESGAAIPAFEFTAHTGVPFTQDSVAGKVYVADFFFTRCPSICPKMTEALVDVQSELQGYADFRIMSHTLDPKNDSIAALAAYAEKHGAQEGIWYFVTGQRSDIYGIAENAYFMAAQYNDGLPDNIIHSSHLILVDRSGMVKGYYDAEDPVQVDDLVADARKLLEA